MAVSRCLDAFINFRLAGNAGRRIGENDGNVSEPKCWCKH